MSDGWSVQRPKRALRSLGIGLVLLISVGWTAGALAAAPTARHPAAGRRVLLVFLPGPQHPRKVPPTASNPPSPTETVLARLERQRSLSLGLVGATQGGFNQDQAFLDLSAGTRTSSASYSTGLPWPMHLVRAGTSGWMDGWLPNKRRAKNAPATVNPGLLASSLVGGGAYVGFSRPRGLEAAAAADEQGTVRRVSMGPAATVAFRARQLLTRHAFVVASLPPRRAGVRQLETLIAQRRPGALLIVEMSPPQDRVPQLLPLGIAGLRSGRPGGLTSPTTRQPGLVAGIDLAPTALRWLHVPLPPDMRGLPIVVSGPPDPGALRAFAKRTTEIGKYRLITAEGMMLLWLALVLALGALRGWDGSLRRGLRLGSLAFMWAPTFVLLEAAVAPANSGVGLALIAVPSFLAAWLTDRRLPWPRGPMAPVAAALLVYTVDLANHSHLIVQSVLGPNPKFGSRYFGLGNEFKSGLTVMLLVGLAAALTGRGKSRNAAAVFAVGGLVLGVILGAGQLGAGVGGVIIVASGAAMATLLMLPGRPSRRAIALACLSPLAALALLAVIDLSTGGNGHLSRNVLGHTETNHLTDIVVRRAGLAWNALANGRRMPLVVAAGLIAITFAYRNRRWLYGPLRDPAWTAALIGGLTCGIVGSVAEDSGPLLFVVAAFALIIVTAYIQGDPKLLTGRQLLAVAGAGTATGTAAAATRRDRGTSSPHEPEPLAPGHERT
jgi:hypothetical protein